MDPKAERNEWCDSMMLAHDRSVVSLFIDAKSLDSNSPSAGVGRGSDFV